MFTYYGGAKRVSVSGIGPVVRRYVGKQQAGVGLIDLRSRQRTWAGWTTVIHVRFFLLLSERERGRERERGQKSHEDWRF